MNVDSKPTLKQVLSALDKNSVAELCRLVGLADLPSTKSGCADMLRAYFNQTPQRQRELLRYDFLCHCAEAPPPLPLVDTLNSFDLPMLKKVAYEMQLPNEDRNEQELVEDIIRKYEEEPTRIAKIYELALVAELVGNRRFEVPARPSSRAASPTAEAAAMPFPGINIQNPSPDRKENLTHGLEETQRLFLALQRDSYERLQSMMSTVIQTTANAVAQRTPPMTPDFELLGSLRGTRLIDTLVHKCQRNEIGFDGSNPDRLPEFIRRLRRVFGPCQLSEADKLQVMSELVSGAAGRYYGSCLKHIKTFDGVVTELEKFYLPVGYKVGMKARLFNRSQHPKERMSDLVVAMKSLNQMLDNPETDADLVNLILSRLNPQCAALVGTSIILDMSQLLKTAIHVDQVIQMQDAYTQPSLDTIRSNLGGNPELFHRLPVTRTPRVHALEFEEEEEEEPRLDALNTPSPVVTQRSVTEARRPNRPHSPKSSDQTEEEGERQRPAADLSRVLCRACREFGHKTPDCKVTARPFCYWCGAPDRTVITCNCRKPSSSNRPGMSQNSRR